MNIDVGIVAVMPQTMMSHAMISRVIIDMSDSDMTTIVTAHMPNAVAYSMPNAMPKTVANSMSNAVPYPTMSDAVPSTVADAMSYPTVSAAVPSTMPAMLSICWRAGDHCR